MDKYKLNWTRLQESIFRLLAINVGNPVNKRYIAKTLEVSPTAVAKSLEELERRGIVKIEKQGNMNLNYVELDRDNQKIIELKRVENLKMIYESGLGVFLEEAFPGATVIVFGSYSRGEDTIKSDIDIAIIGNKEKNVELGEYEKFLEREVRINFYESWSNINKNLKGNILNGIILSGSVDL